MAAVTQWFAGTQNPAHEGVYQRKYSDQERYCLYLNSFWRVPAETAEAAALRYQISDWQELPWRGLAEKTEEE